jgi:hypothetical protein
MELHAGEPSHGDAPATDRVQALALPASSPPATASLGLAVGGGAELGVRGLGPSPDVDVGVWLRLVSRLGLRLIGHAAVAPAHLGTQPGSIDVRSQLLGAAAALDLAGEEATWVPSVSLGLGLAHVGATGTAVPPYVSASEDAWAAAPIAAAGLAWRFAHGLRARCDGLGAWTLPAIRVHTPAGDAGWWGAPAIVVSLGLEVLWAD